MKTIWKAKPSINQSGVAPLPFIFWDFLKMFTAALVYGVLISLIAAGFALLLASGQEAGTQQTIAYADVHVAPPFYLMDAAKR